MKVVLIISCLVFTFATAIGAVGKEEAKKEEEQKREYTEEEFFKEVLKRVKDSLVKVKGNNLVNLSEELLKKEHKLKVSELELEKKAEQLKINERAFKKKIKGLQSEQERLLGCISDHENKRKKRIDHMVDVVAGMKPDMAAQVLSVQDVDISIEILGRLQAEKVSKIFNLMEREISARLQKQYMNMKK